MQHPNWKFQYGFALAMTIDSLRRDIPIPQPAFAGAMEFLEELAGGLEFMCTGLSGSFRSLEITVKMMPILEDTPGLNLYESLSKMADFIKEM